MSNLVKRFRCVGCFLVMHNVELERVNEHKASHGFKPIEPPRPLTEHEMRRRERRKARQEGLLEKQKMAKVRKSERKRQRFKLVKENEYLRKRVMELTGEKVEVRVQKSSKVKEVFKERKPHPIYDSQRWRELRFDVLRGNRVCVLCGVKGGNGVVLHVDHIVPVSWDSSLVWERNNLQVLCADCNLGKGARDNTRF